MSEKLKHCKECGEVAEYDTDEQECDCADFATMQFNPNCSKCKGTGVIEYSGYYCPECDCWL